MSEFKAPDGDRFQVITEHPSGWIVADPEYVGITRTVDAIFIQISMNVGRTIEQKKGFYKKVADELNERLGVRRASSRWQKRTGPSATGLLSMRSRGVPFLDAVLLEPEPAPVQSRYLAGRVSGMAAHKNAAAIKAAVARLRNPAQWPNV